MTALHRFCCVLVLAYAIQAFAAPLPACNVLDFGAKGDNTTEDTQAVQTAVNNCSLVQFPAPGKYLIRPVYLGLHDNITLQIDAGAVLVAWSDPNSWNTSSAVRPLLWTDGWRGDTRTPLTNLTITGGGTIDGQGWRWWPYLKTRSRPILINIAIASHLMISNVTLIDSPSFHIQASVVIRRAEEP
jgi:polygalacturonase